MQKKYSVFSFSLFFCSALLFLTMSAVSAQSLLSDNFRIADEFHPGLGKSVGEVLLTRGQVLVIHEDKKDTAYTVLKGTPLFRGDQIITSENSKASLRLSDGSILTLTTESSLIINESILQEESERISFISVTLGRVRFLVKKYLDFKRSKFTVKSKTAIVGVRGSDFIVEAMDRYTKVTALEDTNLEIVSLTAPCKSHQQMTNPEECEIEPVRLTDFRQVLVTEEGQMQLYPDLLPPDEIENMKEEFIIRGDEQEYTRKTEDTDLRKEILVSADKLIPPDLRDGVSFSAEDTPDPIRRFAEDSDFYGEGATGLADDISQHLGHYILESSVKETEDLPGFPELPEKF